MKKLYTLFIAMCLAIMPALQSCDNNDGYSLGDFTPPLWATVRTTGNAFYLDCDVWGTLWPVNTDLVWYEAIDGQRVITSFNPLSDDYAEYDHAVKILYLQNVLTKEVETLTAENDEEFGHDPLFIYDEDMGISGGYLNLIFMQNLPKDNTKHRISLVQAEQPTPLADDGYIYLELRYNDYNSLSGVRKPGAVSYNLNKLNITTDTKGIKVKLKSEEDGDVEVAFNLVRPEGPKTFGNLDLSGMQLK